MVSVVGTGFAWKLVCLYSIFDNFRMSNPSVAGPRSEALDGRICFDCNVCCFVALADGWWQRNVQRCRRTVVADGLSVDRLRLFDPVIGWHDT